MNITRKPRNKMNKKVDLLVPITIMDFGSDKDPCFGQHFDPKTPECGRCGDSELCAIATSQSTTIKRAKIEKTQSFKDMEERDIKSTDDPAVIRKQVKNRIREMVKMGGGKGVKIEAIVNDVFASYSKDGYTQAKIKKIIQSIVEKSDKITSKNSHLIWSQ